MLVEAQAFYLVLMSAPNVTLDPILKQLTAMATEMAWLLGRRAIVAA